MRRLVSLLAALLVAGTLLAVPGSAQAARLPSKARWERDVARVMKTSVADLQRRVDAAGPRERLAINLDIDNTSLATTYERFAPVGPTLRLAQEAQSLGVAVLFNTGRLQKNLGRATRLLQEAGFPVDGICGRQDGQALRASKQACRARFRDQGYVLVANVGNRRTDFVGGGYERAYRLPSYGGKLS